MADNKYFQKALASMVEGAAYVDAIRHLHDAGLSIDAIKKQVNYPVSVEKIEQVIKDYEEEKASPESEYEFIQKTDAYGRRSFIKVKK